MSLRRAQVYEQEVPSPPSSPRLKGKVLKALKVLNFSGTGKSNIVTCTFTCGAVEGLRTSRAPTATQ
jgi:hypothetical protein